MRKLFIGLLATAVIAAGFFGLRQSLHGAAGPLALPEGDREIAWIQAATSVGSWERFVTGVLRVSHDWPELTVDDSGAFPEETTTVPEIALSLQKSAGKIRIRWYKLSKNANATDWVERLSKRNPAPLALIGGGSSDRAFDLAKAMNERKTWLGERPLLFFTTATASAIVDPNEALPINLMDVYLGRSFRMCFNNAQIARAVVEFVWSRPDLRPVGDPRPLLAAIGASSVEGVLPCLAAEAEYGMPIVSALEWDDDPYSVDLSRQFHAVFHDDAWGRVLVRETRGIPFSVGGQYDPNQWEAEAAEHLLAGLVCAPMERQLLVLPTVAAPARRVLRSITGALPLVGKSLVALTGDSISLNNVYRDSDIGWNIRALPVPLVFFAHQNPVGWDESAPEEDRVWPPGRQPIWTKPDEKPAKTTGGYLAPPTNTDELLQHRDMIRVIAEAAYGVSEAGEKRLIASSDELARRLHQRSPPLFGRNGDRIGGQGEYVLCLRPQFSESGTSGVSQVLSTATLEIWTRTADIPVGPGAARWVPVRRLILNHGRDSRENP